MSKAIIMKGLPGSGKTTWAKQFVEKHPNYIRISRDDLRRMRGKYWLPKQEGLITDMVDQLIWIAFNHGFSIVIDECTLNPKREEYLKSTLDQLGIKQISVQYMKADVEECVKRDLQRQHSVGREVIEKMYNAFIKEDLREDQDPDLPHAIIVDLDGTLALYEGDPYERDFSKDRVNSVVKYIVDHYHGLVIILSGRNDKFKDVSKKWIESNLVYPPQVFEMRKDGDFRKDYVVKKEMFEKFVKGKYYIDFVLDDRNQVVKLWRELGLTCLQVADGNF